MHRTFRHIVLFKLFDSITTQQLEAALKLLQELGQHNPHILEWKIAQSIDTRKGIVLVENGLFTDEKAYQEFRTSPKHAKVVDLMKQISDWFVADYLE